MAYAVIDFETTGVMPERGDRVAEVGIVLTDDAGRIEFEWTTLVNPQRDVGASHIHGLRARDLIDAPTFSDVADDILELLAGRTVTAHNAVFDMRLCKTAYAVPSPRTDTRWLPNRAAARRTVHDEMVWPSHRTSQTRTMLRSARHSPARRPQRPQRCSCHSATPAPPAQHVYHHRLLGLRRRYQS